MAATTFVSQNIGARKYRRADRGTWTAVFFTIGVTAAIAVPLFVFAAPVNRLFTNDRSVIEFAVLFIRTNVLFLVFNCVNHVLAGALRGQGDARGPMVIMLACFVVIRQIYLFVLTRFIANTPALVGFGYPVGWMTCCAIEIIYWFARWRGKEAPVPDAEVEAEGEIPE